MIVLGLGVSIPSAVYSQPMAERDAQEVRRVMRYIEDQKNAISNALNIALMQRDGGVISKVFKQAGYMMDAGFIAAGAGVVLANGENFRSEDKIRMSFLLPIIASFALIYAALYLTFEYLLPDSGVKVQKDALQQLIKTLNGQKQALEKILERGEYSTTI